MRRFLSLVLLISALLGLSGCVYLRLLDLRSDLADFDHRIEVGPGPGLELRFRQPPLLAEDVTTLVGAGPTAKATFPGGEVWTYAFRRLPTDVGQDPPTASTTLMLMAVMEDGRLKSVVFPAEVFQAVPRELALVALRAMGRARIDTARRSAETELGPWVGMPSIPDGPALLAVFGQPNRRQDLPGGGQRWVWRYHLENSDGTNVIAAMAFVFAPHRPSAVQFQVNVSGMWLYLGLR